MEEKILGRMSRLYVTKMTKNGVYLGSYEYPELKVLLPNNQGRLYQLRYCLFVHAHP